MGWYFIIVQEMREMGLKGNELIVYAVINGFSQNGNGSFHGSLAALQEMCGISSRQTIIDILKSLMDKGLINKTEVTLNGVKNISYSVCPKNGQGVQKMDRRCPENGHIYINDININSESNKGRPKFQKPTIPEIAAYCMERGNNIDPEEFFNFYESKGWVIGKSPMKDWKACIRTWERNKRTPFAPRQAAPQRKKSAFEHNLEVADQMFGTNLSQIYEENLQ